LVSESLVATYKNLLWQRIYFQVSIMKSGSLVEANLFFWQFLARIEGFLLIEIF
jgi:hypothetical protein